MFVGGGGFFFFGEEKGFEFECLREKSGLLKVILSGCCECEGQRHTRSRFFEKKW